MLALSIDKLMIWEFMQYSTSQYHKTFFLGLGEVYGGDC